MKTIVLTGDRPTARLHQDHYVGSLIQRFSMQSKHRCFFMIADYQALTTRSASGTEVESHVSNLVMDFLAAGLDPEKSSCFLQSQVPQLAELTTIFGNLVTLPMLLEMPFMKGKKPGLKSDEFTFGFVGYPVSQAADILLFRPAFVPVGEDQRPFVKLAQEVAARFNSLYGETLPIPEGIYREGFLSFNGDSTDGKKEGEFSDHSLPKDAVRRKVAGIESDSHRVQTSGPGTPENCPGLGYHQISNCELERDAVKCREATLEYEECRFDLADSLIGYFEEFRERRAKFEETPHMVQDVLNLGGSQARIEGQRTLEVVKEAMGLSYRGLFA